MKNSFRSRILKKCDELGVYVYFIDKTKTGYKLKIESDSNYKGLEDICKIIKVKKSTISTYRFMMEDTFETISIFVEEK